MAISAIGYVIAFFVFCVSFAFKGESGAGLMILGMFIAWITYYNQD